MPVTKTASAITGDSHGMFNTAAAISPPISDSEPKALDQILVARERVSPYGEIVTTTLPG